MRSATSPTMSRRCADRPLPATCPIEFRKNWQASQAAIATPRPREMAQKARWSGRAVVCNDVGGPAPRSRGGRDGVRRRQRCSRVCGCGAGRRRSRAGRSAFASRWGRGGRWRTRLSRIARDPRVASGRCRGARRGEAPRAGW
jgi:hypothetical protein